MSGSEQFKVIFCATIACILVSCRVSYIERSILDGAPSGVYITVDEYEFLTRKNDTVVLKANILQEYIPVNDPNLAQHFGTNIEIKGEVELYMTPSIFGKLERLHHIPVVFLLLKFINEDKSKIYVADCEIWKTGYLKYLKPR